MHLLWDDKIWNEVNLMMHDIHGLGLNCTVGSWVSHHAKG